MPNAIEISGLGKTYTVGFARRRQVRALAGLSLAVPEGQVFGLLGPNGAGKSTTIKILLNLIAPSSGSARVFGHPPRSVAARSLMGYLPENPAPYEYLSGREFVTFSGQLAGLGASEAARRAVAAIDRVGMGAAADLQVRRYSKGMVQRISLAQSLVASPRLLVLDEPTSGLDVLGRRLVRDIVLEERKRGTTVLFCSHIIPDVEELCDAVAVLIGGALHRQGTVSQLLADERAVMDMVLDQVTLEALEPIRRHLTSVEELGGRIHLRFEERHSADVLALAVAVRARVSSLTRGRSSLEDVFLAALKDTRHSLVGGQIS